MKSTQILIALCILSVLLSVALAGTTTGTAATGTTGSTTVKKSGAVQLLPSLLTMVVSAIVYLCRQA